MAVIINGDDIGRSGKQRSGLTFRLGSEIHATTQSHGASHTLLYLMSHHEHRQGRTVPLTKDFASYDSVHRVELMIIISLFIYNAVYDMCYDLTTS
jgi:hypothetical protein